MLSSLRRQLLRPLGARPFYKFREDPERVRAAQLSAAEIREMLRDPAEISHAEPYEIDEPVGLRIVRLNDVSDDGRNALGLPATRELHRRLRLWEKNDLVDAVVITPSTQGATGPPLGSGLDFKSIIDQRSEAAAWSTGPELLKHGLQM